MELRRIEEELIGCRACPRLVAWREEVARTRRAAYRDEEYWGRPVPAFGDPNPSVLVVGLAPAAHGANRTGRMFTGDRSGLWLYRALYRAGLASAPESVGPGDGLRLHGVLVTAALRCAPPDNRPTPEERRTCRPWLERELDALENGLVGIVALGGLAWSHTLRILRDRDWGVPVPRPSFGHGTRVDISRPGSDAGSPMPDLALLGSYHPSQQNTFTGRLTEPMFDSIWSVVRGWVPAPLPQPDGEPREKRRFSRNALRQ